MMKLYILKENNRFNKHFIILNPMGIKFKQHTHNDRYNINVIFLSELIL